MPTPACPLIDDFNADPNGRGLRIEVDAASWAPPADAADRARARWFILAVLLVLGGQGFFALLEAAHASWFGDPGAAGDHLTKAAVLLPSGVWGYLRWTRDARGEHPHPAEIGDEHPRRR